MLLSYTKNRVKRVKCRCKSCNTEKDATINNMKLNKVRCKHCKKKLKKLKFQK